MRRRLLVGRRQENLFGVRRRDRGTCVKADYLVVRRADDRAGVIDDVSEYSTALDAKEGAHLEAQQYPNGFTVRVYACIGEAKVTIATSLVEPDVGEPEAELDESQI